MVSSAGVRVLSLRRALNLGTSWCVTIFVPNLVSGTIDINPGPVPLFSHPHGICRYQSTTLVLEDPLGSKDVMILSGRPLHKRPHSIPGETSELILHSN